MLQFTAYCDSCFQSLILEEERERLTYTNQSVYVRKVEKNESNSDDSHEKQENSSDSYFSVSDKYNTIVSIINSILLNNFNIFFVQHLDSNV